MYLIYPKTSDIQSRRFVYDAQEGNSLVLNTLFFDVNEGCFAQHNTSYRIFELMQETKEERKEA